MAGGSAISTGVRSIWRFLTNTGTPWPVYVLRTVPVVIVPALIISTLLIGGLEMAGIQPKILTDANAPLSGLGTPLTTVIDFFGYVVMSPIVDTVLMAGIFFLLHRAGLGFAGKIGVQTALWVVLHSLLFPVWGLTIAWGFFVFSVAFLAWQRDHSTPLAVVVVSLIHAGNNAIAFLLSFVAGA